MITKTHTHNVMNVVKGVSIGLLAGAAVGFAGKQMMDRNPRFRKKANRAISAVGNILDTAQYMFR